MEKEPFKEFIADGKNVGPGTLVEVMRATYFSICDGPPVCLSPPARIVLFNRTTIAELFAAKRIRPIDPGIPEVGRYRANREIRITVDGHYQKVCIGDVVELSAAEAAEYLAYRSVIPVDEKSFRL